MRTTPVVLASGACVMCGAPCPDVIESFINPQRNAFYKVPEGRVISFRTCRDCTNKTNHHPSGFVHGEKLALAVQKAAKAYDFQAEVRQEKADAERLTQRCLAFSAILDSGEVPPRILTQVQTTLHEYDTLALSDKLCRARIQFCLSRALFASGDVRRAIEPAREAAVLMCEHAPGSSEEGAALLSLGSILVNNLDDRKTAAGFLSTADACLTKALVIAEKTGSPSPEKVRAVLRKCAVCRGDFEQIINNV